MKKWGAFFIFIFVLVCACSKNPAKQDKPSPPEGMVLVDGGSFQMGSEKGDDNEKPVHTVTLSAFYISKYEITNGEFCDFLNENGNQNRFINTWLDIDDPDCLIAKEDGLYQPKPGFTNHPVVEVSWYGAKSFCSWKGGRLPTEAEWEFAARGGTESYGFLYSGSDFAKKVAHYFNNFSTHVSEVGIKISNEIGTHDMSGNAWEWCADWYKESYYSESDSINPEGPVSGISRVVRGGSWLSYTNVLRCSARGYYKPEFTDNNYGFRLVIDP
ncbi:MAG: formylglycine-generating enzyme family protein [Calditrichaeota bacterium]|nr:MAG: formylglycine-generating enzyme family protein [Calditrichota bacterium]